MKFPKFLTFEIKYNKDVKYVSVNDLKEWIDDRVKYHETDLGGLTVLSLLETFLKEDE